MLPRWRKATWVMVAYNTLMPAAVLEGVPLARHAWLLGSLVLGVLWVASLPRRRSCPNCGSSIPQTFMVCPVCRHDSYVRVPLPVRSQRDSHRR
jgi:hypothetical protein